MGPQVVTEGTRGRRPDLPRQIRTNISKKVTKGPRNLRVPCDYPSAAREGAALRTPFIASLPNKVMQNPPGSLGVLACLSELSGKKGFLERLPKVTNL